MFSGPGMQNPGWETTFRLLISEKNNALDYAVLFHVPYNTQKTTFL